MKKIFTLCAFLLCFQGVFAQLNFLPKFIRQMYLRSDSNRKPGLVLLPALSSAPETGVEFGGAALLSFYSDPADLGTRVSNLYGYSTLTTKGQAKLSLNASYWLPQNKFHYTANISYYNFPNNFYGIGNNTPLDAKDLVKEKRYKASFNGEKQLGQYFYVGFVSGFLNFIALLIRF